MDKINIRWRKENIIKINDFLPFFFLLYIEKLTTLSPKSRNIIVAIIFC